MVDKKEASGMTDLNEHVEKAVPSFVEGLRSQIYTRW